MWRDTFFCGHSFPETSRNGCHERALRRRQKTRRDDGRHRVKEGRHLRRRRRRRRRRRERQREREKTNFESATGRDARERPRETNDVASLRISIVVPTEKGGAFFSLFWEGTKPTQGINQNASLSRLAPQRAEEQTQKKYEGSRKGRETPENGVDR